MKLYSNDFEDGGLLPEKFTCNGDGARPSLLWTDVPGEAQSLAITLVDPDAPGGDYVHWILAEIPPDVSSLDFDDIVGLELTNTSGSIGYVAPCPPSGQHHYNFTLYALDILKLEREADQNFFDTVRPHIIEQSRITAIYGQRL